MARKAAVMEVETEAVEGAIKFVSSQPQYSALWRGRG